MEGKFTPFYKGINITSKKRLGGNPHFLESYVFLGYLSSLFLLYYHVLTVSYYICVSFNTQEIPYHWFKFKSNVK
jgi:hypothetical protein